MKYGLDRYHRIEVTALLVSFLTTPPPYMDYPMIILQVSLAGNS